ALGRIIAFNDRVSCLVKMLRGMAMGRAITAAHMPADAAEPQMYPARTDLQTFLTAERAGRHLAYCGNMRAPVTHRVLWCYRCGEPWLSKDIRATPRPPARLRRRQLRRALPSRTARHRRQIHRICWFRMDACPG